MPDKTNRNKEPVIDESILDEVPPNINEPQTTDNEPENQDPNPDPVTPPVTETPVEPTPTDADQELDSPPSPEPAPVIETPTETDEQKEQRFKQQQTEAQIQIERNKALTSKVDEASQIPAPTLEELKVFVAQDGVDWDELTVFEQSMAKKSYLAEKRFTLVNEAVQTTKKIDERAKEVDAFIDSTDAKPEFIELQGHEADFRKFCMQESHRGVDIQSILLPAFLHNLPPVTKKRGDLFPQGGAGEADNSTGKITDADTNKNLRETNPREWRRQVKAGNIIIEA